MRKTMLLFNQGIDRALEMTFDAPLNVGKHVTSTIACGYSQWYTKNHDECYYVLRNFAPIVGPKAISNGPTNRLWYVICWPLSFCINVVSDNESNINL